MQAYIFLDNWVFSMLSDEKLRQRLICFLRTNGYTTILTSLALTELYNPGWTQAPGPDRVERAVNLLSQVPCIIVEPREVYAAEIEADLQPVQKLPVKFDLEDMERSMRAEVLRRLLRRDPLFLEQGHDIQLWADNVAIAKMRWLEEVQSIIENACGSGYLLRDPRGRLSLPAEGEEWFLYSLDFRHTQPDRIDAILRSHLERRASGAPFMPTAIRLSSLYFLHTYVGIDRSERIKRLGSDIVDMYHLSLAAYCAAFTTDKSMFRMFQAVRRSGVTLSCRVMTKTMLEEAMLTPHDPS